MSLCTIQSQEMKTTEQPIELWGISLCNPQKNVKQSVEFMQKLTMIAISNITHLRNIFPDDAYITRNLSGTEVRILRENDEVPTLNKFMSYVRLALKALSLQYLHKMIFVIEERDSDNKEIYTLNFTYTDPTNSFDKENENGDNINVSQSQDNTPEFIKEQTHTLLWKISALINRKQPLSNKISVHFRLVLNEDAPEDFKLDLYEPCDEIPEIDHPKKKLKLGKVKTFFHTLTTTNHVPDSLSEKEDEKENEDEIFINEYNFTSDTEINITNEDPKEEVNNKKLKSKKKNPPFVRKLDQRRSKRRL